MAAVNEEDKLPEFHLDNPPTQAQIQQVVSTYKSMLSDVQQLSHKIGELNGERNEHE